jgi:hypothetical protein
MICFERASAHPSWLHEIGMHDSLAAASQNILHAFPHCQSSLDLRIATPLSGQTLQSQQRHFWSPLHMQAISNVAYDRQLHHLKAPQGSHNW